MKKLIFLSARRGVLQMFACLGALQLMPNYFWVNFLRTEIYHTQIGFPFFFVEFFLVNFMYDAWTLRDFDSFN